MPSYDAVLNILKENGLKEGEGVAEFWFKNASTLMPIIYGPSHSDDTFSTQVRWKTEIGIACQAAVRKYIEDTVKNVEQTQQKLMSSGDYRAVFGRINFVGFSFNFQGQSYDINSFVNLYDTVRYLSMVDLRGIDLSGIWIKNCEIEDCCITSANFDNSIFNQVTLKNTFLNESSFNHSCIASLRLENKSQIGGVDFSTTEVSVVLGMDNASVSVPFLFKEVSYGWLIRQLILKLKNKNYSVKHDIKENHTFFNSNDTLSMTSIDLKNSKEYINWFQNVCRKINNLHKLKRRKKISFILSIISTKHWTSYSAFAVFSTILNLIFTLCIYFGHNNFYSNGAPIEQNLITSFYYSTVTFTTLGYGDIAPHSHFGQVVVMLEVITGYVTLGLFVYLISRKIDREN